MANFPLSCLPPTEQVIRRTLATDAQTMAKTAGELVVVFTLLVAVSTIRVGSKVDLVGSDEQISSTATTTSTTTSPVDPVVEVHVSVKLPVAKNDSNSSDEKTKAKKKGNDEEVEKDEVPIIVGLKGIASKTEAPDIPVYPGLKLGPEFEAHFPKSSPSPLPPVQEEIPILVYQDLAPKWYPTTPPRKFLYPRPPQPYYPRYRPSLAGRRTTVFVPNTRPAIHRNYFPVTWRVTPTVTKIDGKLDFES